jgi:hypothetical protein
MAKINKFIEEVSTGKRESSVVSTDTVESLSMDEKEAWRLLRKELEDIGITPHLFTTYRELIIIKFKDAVDAGDFQGLPWSEVDDNDTQSSTFKVELSEPEGTGNIFRSPLSPQLITANSKPKGIGNFF